MHLHKIFYALKLYLNYNIISNLIDALVLGLVKGLVCLYNGSSREVKAIVLLRQVLVLKLDVGAL